MAELLLPEVAAARGREDLAAVLREALNGLDADVLPLQQALTHGSVAIGGVRDVLLVSSRERGDRLLLRIGLFFNSMIAGCSCADDPTPVELLEEYGEFDLDLDIRTGQGQIRPAA